MELGAGHGPQRCYQKTAYRLQSAMLSKKSEVGRIVIGVFAELSGPWTNQSRRQASRMASLLLATSFGAGVFSGPVNAQQLELPMPGHRRSLTITPLADDGTAEDVSPVIDGDLTESAWTRATPSGGFWNSIQDRAPSDQTEVLALMDDEYLYFAFRMYESEPAAIQATRSIRDGDLGYDDSITIELDTFFNRRDISEFSVNPLGTQTDEIAGGRSTKIEWKGDWLGAATRTEYGWSAEFAIPFAILNYDDDATRFGVNFKRYQSRTRENSYWANITPQGLEEEMGHIAGLELPSLIEKRAWTFMPFALAGRNIEDENGKVDDSLFTVGLDVRYQPRPDLTGVFSINPDFSQVEEAITDISFSYSEKSLDENRPFFREGTDYFSSDDDDDEYFYSNRIPDFDVGAKSFGRMGRTQYGLLTTIAPDDRRDFVGRTLYEVDETNSAIATVVSSNRTEFDNLLGVAQFRGRQPSGLNYSVDFALSDTSNVSDPALPDGDGNHYKGSIGWRSDYFYASLSADKYETNYFPSNALLDEDLPGTDGAGVSSGYYREMQHPLLRVVDAYVGATQRETVTGQTQRKRVYGGAGIEFTSDIRVSFYVEEGPYRRVTDDRGVFEDEINDDRYSSIWVDFNTRSNRYSGGIQYDNGDLGGGPYEYIAAYGWWRPSNSVFLKVSAERIDSFGTFNQVVLESTWDINTEHALSGRYIKADDVDLYRLAYSHRPRQGLDIFAVYDKATAQLDEFSIKVVKTF